MLRDVEGCGVVARRDVSASVEPLLLPYPGGNLTHSGLHTPWPAVVPLGCRGIPCILFVLVHQLLALELPSLWPSLFGLAFSNLFHQSFGGLQVL